MNREQIIREDFPAGANGYDRPSVDAHLAAVAAWTAALESQVNALEVERDTLRRQTAAVAQSQPDAEVVKPPRESPEPVSGESAAGAEAAKDLDGPPSVESELPGQDAGPVVRSDNEVSARLLATRLALEGVEPEQIRGQLTAAFELDDPDSLVDDVLARLA